MGLYAYQLARVGRTWGEPLFVEKPRQLPKGFTDATLLTALQEERYSQVEEYITIKPELAVRLGRKIEEAVLERTEQGQNLSARQIDVLRTLEANGAGLDIGQKVARYWGHAEYDSQIRDGRGGFWVRVPDVCPYDLSPTVATLGEANSLAKIETLRHIRYALSTCHFADGRPLPEGRYFPPVQKSITPLDIQITLGDVVGR